MAKPRLFSTAAVKAMSDTELTGQEWRVYLWVSLHDGMSLVKGTGRGCIASNKTLFAKAGCDYSSGCRALSKLVARGHLVRETHGRATVYRVTFPEPDNLQGCNISSAQTYDEPASDDAAIGCKDNFEPRANLPKTEQDYIPLKGRIDSVETEELDSAEAARFSFKGINAAKAVLGMEEYGSGIGAVLARFERGFDEDPKSIGDIDGQIEWLNQIAETHCTTDEKAFGRATRLIEKLDMYAWEIGQRPDSTQEAAA